MRKTTIGFAAALAACFLSGTAGLSGVQPAFAENCYQRSSYLRDICNGGDDAYYTYASSKATATTVAGAAYGVVCYPNKLDVFDLTTPTSPSKLTSQALSPPWWLDEGNHTYLTDHIKTPITVEGLAYAVVPLYSWGWDFLRLAPNPEFIKTGYKPGWPLTTQQGRYSSMGLFRTGTDYYLAGQNLDSTAAKDRNDNNIYVYKVADATGLTPEAVSAETMAAQRIRVPVGSSSDAPYDSFSLPKGSTLDYWSYEMDGIVYLVIRSGSSAVIVDVTDPESIIGGMRPVAKLGSGGFSDNRLFSGPWTVDSRYARIVVAEGAELVFYDISDPTQPALLYSIPWSTKTTQKPVTISSAGDLLACGLGKWTGFISLGAATPEAMPDEEPFTYNPRACAEDQTLGGESLLGIAVLEVNGVHAAVRAFNASSDVVTVSDTCLSCSGGPGDADSDAGVDGGGDLDSDAGQDAGADAGADAETDAGTDAGGDVPEGGRVGGGCSCSSQSAPPAGPLLLLVAGLLVCRRRMRPNLPSAHCVRLPGRGVPARVRRIRVSTGRRWWGRRTGRWPGRGWRPGGRRRRLRGRLR